MKSATVILFFILCAGLHAERRQLPLEALNYIHFLKKAEFDERFPGVVLEGQILPTQEGFYVVYEHESLTYYFGPTAHRSIAQAYKNELDKTVAEVQQMREALRSAKTVVMRLPQESEDPDPPVPPQTEPTSAGRPSSPPQPDPPWWKKLFRFFGL